MTGLRVKRSDYSSRVKLVELDPQNPAAPEGIGKESKAITEIVKDEPISPVTKRISSNTIEISNASPHFTSLRRTTRSTTISTPSTSALQDADPSSIINTSPSKLDLSSFAYPNAPADIMTPPRKRSKRTHLNSANGREDTPLTSIKQEQGDLEFNGHTPVKTEMKPDTPVSARKKPLPQLKLEKAHPEPSRWKEQYKWIEHMRKGIVAPVDDMGCERPQTMADADPMTMRFHILISLMLSSQTKDAITSQAVTNLHTTLPSGLTAQSLAEAPKEIVEGCINKVGFWRRKTEYIQEAAKKLLEQEGEARGDVPKTLEGLCELKGVGPKMAFLALQCAWDINAGIGVDVHVHRITNRLKWHKPPTQNPEQTRLNLQSWLPPTLHKSINPMLVGFGQVICLPVGPRCDICLLGKKGLCPSKIKVDPKGRKEVVYTFEDVEDIQGGLMGTSSGSEVILMETGIDGVKVEVQDGPLAKVEVGYEEGPLVKLEPGVSANVDGSEGV